MASGKGISEGYFGRKCRNLILKYVKDGTLKRPEICDKCGEHNELIVAHHYDYILPFDILWMCPKCHRRLHYDLRILTPRNKQTILCNRMAIMRSMILEAFTGENISENDLNIDVNNLPFRVKLDGMIITMCKYCGCIWDIQNDDNPLICPKCNNDISETKNI